MPSAAPELVYSTHKSSGQSSRILGAVPTRSLGQIPVMYLNDVFHNDSSSKLVLAGRKVVLILINMSKIIIYPFKLIQALIVCH